MAISRHHQEWQEMVAAALIAGVRLDKTTLKVWAMHTKISAWMIVLPCGRAFYAISKFKGAKAALEMMMLPEEEQRRAHVPSYAAPSGWSKAGTPGIGAPSRMVRLGQRRAGV